MTTSEMSDAMTHNRIGVDMLVYHHFNMNKSLSFLQFIPCWCLDGHPPWRSVRCLGCVLRTLSSVSLPTM